MIGRTNVGGGGGGNQKVIEGLATAIGVQYPVGWACTCTKGSTTLTAKTTTGLIVFNLPAAGTWTVKATTGSGSSAQPKVIKVTIAENEFKYINLRTLEVLTPANGKNSDYTLGGSGASMVGNKLVLDDVPATATVGKNSYFTPAIDVTGYSHLIIKGKGTDFVDMYSMASFALTQDAGGHTYNDGKALISFAGTGDEVEKQADISGLSGSLYLSMNVFRQEVQITEIILT